jgi:hypothetical protein
MTTRSNVANIGDMAFLDFNIVLIDVFYHLVIIKKSAFVYLTCMNPEFTFKINV